MKIIKLIKLIRPKQWLKNVFCFAPILFSGNLFYWNKFSINLIAFIAFCGISSCVYILNDISDVESDRNHKKKRFRPIASGDVSVNEAWAFFALLLVLVACACIFYLPLSFGIVIILYLINNFLYSYKLKHMVLLDVFSISIGFMLRVVGGGFAIDVQLSSWMIITTIFISLFLGISKRRAELANADEGGATKQRRVLDDYSIDFVEQMNTIAATGTILSYALYTASDKTITTFHTDKLIYTTPFVIYGIFRYLYLMHKKNLGENPASIVTKDIPIIVTGILWVIVCAAIIYKAKLGL